MLDVLMCLGVRYMSKKQKTPHKCLVFQHYMKLKAGESTPLILSVSGLNTVADWCTLLFKSVSQQPVLV